jgi:hypothetical protein
MVRTETFYLGAFVGGNPLDIPRFMCLRWVQRFFLGNISPNFNLKILISTFLKDFEFETKPKFTRF